VVVVADGTGTVVVVVVVVGTGTVVVVEVVVVLGGAVVVVVVLGGAVVVVVTVVTVVDVTEPGPVVTVVVAVVTDRGRVVVVTDVVGDTTLVVVAGAAFLGAGWVAAPAGAWPAVAPIPTDVTAATAARPRTSLRLRPGRVRARLARSWSCPWCICAPPSTPRGSESHERHRDGPCSGNPADSGSPVVLRPLLAEGLPFVHAGPESKCPVPRVSWYSWTTLCTMSEHEITQSEVIRP
jgi:hypothetical protein